jgi:hypothetical protein
LHQALGVLGGFALYVEVGFGLVDGQDQGWFVPGERRVPGVRPGR